MTKHISIVNACMEDRDEPPKSIAAKVKADKEHWRSTLVTENNVRIKSGRKVHYNVLVLEKFVRDRITIYNNAITRLKRSNMVRPTHGIDAITDKFRSKVDKCKKQSIKNIAGELWLSRHSSTDGMPQSELQAQLFIVQLIESASEEDEGVYDNMCVFMSCRVVSCHLMQSHAIPP